MFRQPSVITVKLASPSAIRLLFFHLIYFSFPVSGCKMAQIDRIPSFLYCCFLHVFFSISNHLPEPNNNHGVSTTSLKSPDHELPRLGFHTLRLILVHSVSSLSTTFAGSETSKSPVTLMETHCIMLGFSEFSDKKMCFITDTWATLDNKTHPKTTTTTETKVAPHSLFKSPKDLLSHIYFGKIIFAPSTSGWSCAPHFRVHAYNFSSAATVKILGVIFFFFQINLRSPGWFKKVFLGEQLFLYGSFWDCSLHTEPYQEVFYHVHIACLRSCW